MAAEANATTLASRRSGTGGRDVVLVHGFAQTSRCWGPLAEHLARANAVRRVDQPGHGGSLRHRDADLVEGARLLVSTAGTAVYVGYSMGARLCLHAALADPERVEALVLIGGTAGIGDDAERAQRRASDEALAGRLELIGVDAFVEEWLAMPMFSTLPGWARFDEERRANTVDGLAASLRRAGTGSMAPLWDHLGAISCPVLCLTGERDERYGALARRIVSSVSGPARHVVVPGAGHAAHLEDPTSCAAAIDKLLASLDA